MTTRSLTRWSLLLLAWLLGIIAVMLLLFRLAASQVDELTPRIETFLEARTGASVHIESLSLGVARNDIILRVKGVEAKTPRGQALFSLGRAELRLNGWASLRHLLPVFSDIHIERTELHLYEGESADWQWPAPAKLPLYIAPEPDVDLAKIDAWTEWLMRQRIRIDDTRVVLHGQQDRLQLVASTLLLTSDEQGAQLRGAVDIRESTSTQDTALLPAVQLLADMQPGKEGLEDFAATLKLEAELDQLVVLAEMFRPEHVPYLEQAGGDARLWGRWGGGQLQEARLVVDVPQLTLRHDIQYAVLRDIEAHGEWQRDGEGGEAWLSGNAQNVEWAQPAGMAEGRALPQHWYLSHQPGQWELRTSAFELASLTAWRDFVLLPESLTRVLQTLAPRGQVQGLRLGQRDGHWGVDAALTDIQVSPWQSAPGGGPLDAWVQARDLRGRVTFNSAGPSTLYFPELFSVPMQLRHAQGVVEWVYDGPNTMVSGRQLSVDWDGAQVSGGFGLVAGKSNGRFGLDIEFADVDALDNPLAQWLPLAAFDPELRAWLVNDIGGKVPYGSLQLSLPLKKNLTADDISATLALEVTQGHLPIAPGWPRLNAIEGRLKWQNQVLEAQVEHAQSHGVTASQGELTLEDETLNVSGELHSDGPALTAFLQALPDIDLSILSDLDAQGHVDGDLALSLPLKAPEALQLEVNTHPAFSRIVYTPLGVPLEEVQGHVAWQQKGRHSGLVGDLTGQLLGGDISADLDTPNNAIALHGQADIAELWPLIDVTADQGGQLLEGRLQWQGQVALTPSPSLALESQLTGVTSHLPEPFAKPAGQAWPWTLDADIANGRIASRLADIAHLRLQQRHDSFAGALNVNDTAVVQPPAWPQQPGLELNASVARVDPMAWQQRIAPLLAGQATLTDSAHFPPLSVALETACLVYQQACVGGVSLTGGLHNGAAQATVDGDLLAGHVDYQPGSAYPLDITMQTLALDPLLDLSLPASNEEATAAKPDSWLHEIETQHETPLAIPDWLAQIPNGRLRLAEIITGEGRFGPLTAYWQADDQRFLLSPVGLTLGQLSARGELAWEESGASSRTQADMSIQGGDVATALERLGQPVAVRSRRTDASVQLAWPGAPWQFALSRASGEISTDVRDGRFVTLESAPVRLVGLLNFDNILRRLRFDFSDVTGQGTAFDKVQGTADVSDGQLRLRGPLQIDAPAATLKLTGNVDLLQRELDQRLGVTLPISQSLPIAALAVGAPIVGGALFIADQLFGDTMDQATTIHYRVRGPWTSPQVTLEGSQ